MSPERIGMVQLGEGSEETSLKKAYSKVGEEFYTMICGNKTRGNSFKLKNSQFSLGIRNKS